MKSKAVNRERCSVNTHLDRDMVKMCFVLTYICPFSTIFYFLGSALSLCVCVCVCVCSSELTNRVLRIYDVMAYLFVTQCEVGLYFKECTCWGNAAAVSCSILRLLMLSFRCMANDK
jgi:hypothetical protein